MPEFGETHNGREIGKKPGIIFIWHACETCGMGRWVRFLRGKPEHTRCKICSMNWRTAGINYHGITSKYERDAIHREKVKREVLTTYGHGKCACVQCGEDRIACLSIDHVNNDGAAERKSRKKFGYHFYRFLIASGYPLGYQTLCMNCQFIKMQDYLKTKTK